MAEPARTLLAGLGLPEGPRWANGQLYFADVYAGEVVAVDLDGRRDTLARTVERPNGLGFLPDGRLLVATMLDRRVCEVKEGGLIEVADLTAMAGDLCNDMVADARGHAYVGGFRFAIGPERLKPHGALPAPLILLDFNRAPHNPEPRVAAADLYAPNGMVVTPDGKTLVVAESARNRLTAFAIEADGSLSGRRPWAALDASPDGLCLDAEGCIWVASSHSPAGFQRVAEGGRVVERIDAGGLGGYACALGGPDRRTLFLLEAPRPPDPEARLGRIRTVRVAVAGADGP